MRRRRGISTGRRETRRQRPRRDRLANLVDPRRVLPQYSTIDPHLSDARHTPGEDSDAVPEASVPS